MEVLILSCSTGGGHNSAGLALKGELEQRGHHVEMLDPYSLTSEKLARGVGSTYVKLVQSSPRTFGLIYCLGELVRKLPFFSPVYRVNARMEKPMLRFLDQKNYDVILMPHLFPAEIFTYLKQKGRQVPPTVFVATDYACIPFTEETSCDYYIVPNEDLAAEFAGKGLPKEKLVPLGIPVGEGFASREPRRRIKRRLGLDPEKSYVIVSGGSMGAGDIKSIVKKLSEKAKGTNRVFLVICGNNQKLFHSMSRRYQRNTQVKIMKSTNQMADYMNACDGIFSKPGGLSSTEAAVAGIPLFHISPIPGCETINRKYFSQKGMSLPCTKDDRDISRCLEFLDHPEEVKKMLENQRVIINPVAARDIVDFVENLVGNQQK